MRYFLVLLLLFCWVFDIKAQIYTDSLGKFKIETSAYMEAYYVFDFAQPENNERANYFVNHRRHNEFNVNHGIIETHINTEGVRANIALMIGTYSQYNLVAEQELIRNIYEGNVGFKLSKKRNLWLDAGIFASHIGFESAISKNCWALSRGLLAENTPYYEAGLKATYTNADEKLWFSLLILNGWQRIKRLDNNSMPSLGTQIQWKPRKNVLLNYSTYWGNEGTDSLKKIRFFNNFYGQWDINDKWGILAGFDIGWQNEEGNDEPKTWMASSLIFRRKLSKNWIVNARLEHFFDDDNTIISTKNNLDFRVLGYSLNFDYAPQPYMLIRMEAKGFSADKEVFGFQKDMTKQNFVLTSSMAVAF
ncbi:MAG: porin [Thermonemataceae bacterium]|nr:porin [Thermonemataceae bacterium]